MLPLGRGGGAKKFQKGFWAFNPGREAFAGIFGLKVVPRGGDPKTGFKKIRWETWHFLGGQDFQGGLTGGF